MKDLYKRNGLESLEQDQNKIHAIKTGLQEDNEAAFAILLKEDRKQVYDEIYKTLKAIGKLRAEFNKNDHYWTSHFSDFVVTSSPSKNATQKAPDKKPSVSRSDNASFVLSDWLSRHLKLISASSVILVIGLLVWMFAGQEPEPENTEREVEKYVLQTGVPLLSQPDNKAGVIRLLNQFESVWAIPEKSVSDWDYVEMPGERGYVNQEFVQVGSGEAAYIDDCRAKGLERPESGADLKGNISGFNQLNVINSLASDVAIKLKDMAGRTRGFYYIHSGGRVELNMIPTGKFYVEQATGHGFSRDCGIFVDDMQVMRSKKYIEFAAPSLPNSADTGFSSLENVGSAQTEVYVITTDPFSHDIIPAKHF